MVVLLLFWARTETGRCVRHNACSTCRRINNRNVDHSHHGVLSLAGVGVGGEWARGSVACENDV